MLASQKRNGGAFVDLCKGGPAPVPKKPQERVRQAGCTDIEVDTSDATWEACTHACRSQLHMRSLIYFTHPHLVCLSEARSWLADVQKSASWASTAGSPATSRKHRRQRCFSAVRSNRTARALGRHVVCGTCKAKVTACSATRTCVQVYLSLEKHEGKQLIVYNRPILHTV